MTDASVHTATVTVTMSDGLHLRPLTMLARTAAQFTSSITLRKGSQTANAKQPFDLMTLAADYGETLTIETAGPDAEAALAAVVRLFETGFADVA